MNDPSRSDRDILIAVETTVEGVSADLKEVKADVKSHASRLDQAEGARRTIVWVIGGIILLVCAFGGVLMAHMLGGK